MYLDMCHVRDSLENGARRRDGQAATGGSQGWGRRGQGRGSADGHELGLVRIPHRTHAMTR